MLQLNLQLSFSEISMNSMQMALLLLTSEARLLDAFGKSKLDIELCQFWSQKTEVDLQTTIESNIIRLSTHTLAPRDSQSPASAGKIRYCPHKYNLTRAPGGDLLQFMQG
jgi:hypothetical protein